MCSWDRCTGFAAGWCGAVLGCVLGVFTWLIYPALYYNDVSIDTTEKNGPVLAGAGVAFGVGVFVPPLVVSQHHCELPMTSQIISVWSRIGEIRACMLCMPSC